jgi:hypothetical protein
MFGEKLCSQRLDVRLPWNDADNVDDAIAAASLDVRDDRCVRGQNRCLVSVARQRLVVGEALEARADGRQFPRYLGVVGHFTRRRLRLLFSKNA